MSVHDDELGPVPTKCFADEFDRVPGEGVADEELLLIVRESAAGSSPSEAFWEFWSRHEKWLSQQTAKLGTMAPRGVSREIFVEAVLDRVRDNLMRGLRLFEGRGSIRAFLRIVVRRAAIDEYWYQKAKHPEMELRPDRSRGGAGTIDDLLSALPGWQPRVVFPPPDRAAETRERRDKLRLALNRLAEGPGRGEVPGLHLAQVIRRHYVDQKTHAEIARECGVVERTVYRWLDAGREELRRLLDEMFKVRGRREL